MSSFSVRHSSIHGHGCFTNVPLQAGIEFAQIENKVSFDDDNPHNVWVDECPFLLLTEFTYINHSKKPNCELWYDDNGFHLTVLRDIEAGEEITIDYGNDFS